MDTEPTLAREGSDRLAAREDRRPRHAGTGSAPGARRVLRTPAHALIVLGAAVTLAGTIVIGPCGPTSRCIDGILIGGSVTMLVGFQALLLGALELLLVAWSQRPVALAPRESSRDEIKRAIARSVPLVAIALALTLAISNRWAPDSVAGLAETRSVGIVTLILFTELLGVLLIAGISLGWASLARRARASTQRATLGSVLRVASSPAGVATLLTLAFVAIGWWWLEVDTRAPTNDAARHLYFARDAMRSLTGGELIEPFTSWSEWGYPPLVHVIGGFAMLLNGGISPIPPTLALVLLFAPLLALGCYRAGAIAYRDRWAGALAVVFALGAPLLMSQFRVFMLDAPLAAMVALAIWLLLASDRFEHRGYTIAFGIAVGIGTMMKTVFPVYVVGLLLVVIGRGGWRNWRNLMWLAVPAAIIAAPWAVAQWADLWAKVTEHLRATSGINWFGPYDYPDRWSLENFTWYGWSTANIGLYLPLTVFLVVGIGVALSDTLRRWRDRANYAPELLVGLATSYFLISLLPIDDPRYLLPALGYMAILGAGWVRRIPIPRLGAAAVMVLVTVAVGNTVLQNVPGLPVQAHIYLNIGERELNPLSRGSLKVASTRGYALQGTPDTEARTDEILAAARRQGVKEAGFVGAHGLFSAWDFLVLPSGLDYPRRPDRLGPDQIRVQTVTPDAPFPPAGEPCTTWSDGTKHYVYRGDSRRLHTPRYAPYCPLNGEIRSSVVNEVRVPVCVEVGWPECREQIEDHDLVPIRRKLSGWRIDFDRPPGAAIRVRKALSTVKVGTKIEVETNPGPAKMPALIERRPAD